MNKIKWEILSLVLSLTFLVSACGNGENSQTITNTSEQSSQIVDSTQEESILSDISIGEETEEYRGFQMDNIFHSQNDGDIHYHIYVPESYDGNEPYALFMTLPGYEGLYFQGVGINLKSEEFAFEAQKYNDRMIIVAPQLSDWGDTSANQTIALINYIMEQYNIDTRQIYANGYSGGGETMSLVLEKEPKLFTAYLHCSSKWDGNLEVIAKNQIPIYLAVGEDDEYYGSEPTKQAYKTLYESYQKQGLSEQQIAQLLVLDVKSKDYFSQKGITNEHAGGTSFAFDTQIMGWLFGQH